MRKKTWPFHSQIQRFQGLQVASFMPVITLIIRKNLLSFAHCSIIHLSPLFSSKEIDLARSCSGLFF